ncbi:hypothetical protein D3C86_1768010 [compost metagenome]
MAMKPVTAKLMRGLWWWRAISWRTRMATEAERQVTMKMGQSPPNSRLKAPQESPTMGITSQGW